MNPKKLVFEHILYEFEMYLDTGILRGCVIKCDGIDQQIFYNMVLESHQLHLRNLIEFFCHKEHAMKMEEILMVDFQLDFKPLKNAYYTICKAVGHLTLERATNDLASACSTAMKFAFPIIVAKINEFLDVISDPNNVQQKYHAELSMEYIAARIDKLKKRTSELCSDGDKNA